MPSRHANVIGVRVGEALLIAFPGSLGWFIWAVVDETNRSCFSMSHYIPSAAVAWVVILAIQLTIDTRVAPARHSPRAGRQRIILLAASAAVTGLLMAAGLCIAAFWAGAISCSA